MKHYRNTIQRITSVFLICIFAFSITPVILIHNAIADHADVTIQHHHTKSSELAKAGMYCHIANFVAERNFLFTYSPIDFTQPLNFQTFSSTYNLPFYSQHHFFAELRGPPAKA